MGNTTNPVLVRLVLVYLTVQIGALLAIGVAEALDIGQLGTQDRAVTVICLSVAITALDYSARRRRSQPGGSSTSPTSSTRIANRRCESGEE